MKDLTTKKIKASVQYEENNLLTRLISSLENKHESFEVVEADNFTHQIKIDFDEKDRYIVVNTENVVYKVENGIKVEIDLCDIYKVANGIKNDIDIYESQIIEIVSIASIEEKNKFIAIDKKSLEDHYSSHLEREKDFWCKINDKYCIHISFQASSFSNPEQESYVSFTKGTPEEFELRDIVYLNCDDFEELWERLLELIEDINDSEQE